MTTVGITGGIAMGKSTVMDLLAKALPEASSFDADRSVREHLTSGVIRRKIAEVFGGSALGPDGQVDRVYLRKQVFDSAQRRAELEDILHPEVRRDFEKLRALALQKTDRADAPAPFFADIPLLFESGSGYPCDVRVVVACDPHSQMQRLLARKGIDEATALKMIGAQWPIARKIALADVVLWNSGTIKQLQRQIELFSKWLKTRN